MHGAYPRVQGCRDWEGAQRKSVMGRRYDHIDLRVQSLAEARPFYETLLPALGFTRRAEIDGWLQFEAAESTGTAEFFGITEEALHQPNSCRIAFWAESKADVDRLADVVQHAGARNIEGPSYDEGPGYYAVFFEDPSGNRLEICHRGIGVL
jgi:predicted enzyme related to lactoylglutathione lyase